MARNGSRFRAAKRAVAAYIAMVIISPWAKLTTRTTPKITDRPSAISPYTRPVSSPETTTFATRSSAGMALCARRLRQRLAEALAGATQPGALAIHALQGHRLHADHALDER